MASRARRGGAGAGPHSDGTPRSRLSPALALAALGFGALLAGCSTPPGTPPGTSPLAAWLRPPPPNTDAPFPTFGAPPRDPKARPVLDAKGQAAMQSSLESQGRGQVAAVQRRIEQESARQQQNDSGSDEGGSDDEGSKTGQ
ncbi:hypothetical protein MWN34_01110 [Ancylobacter sp. 6x-1]|uniref:DUF3035 domain-containing protein n=1 Tax=Ancylobacter crimeensis TaxID=2579147 RepID=A0ABT0D6D4_9HYPH|nr:hypothetical protein [Ancylobacter crimeensis]MCK0195505.1 hypothetical protein [Ancylobacter crimeensis]